MSNEDLSESAPKDNLIRALQTKDESLLAQTLFDISTNMNAPITSGHVPIPLSEANPQIISSILGLERIMRELTDYTIDPITRKSISFESQDADSQRAKFNLLLWTKWRQKQAGVIFISPDESIKTKWNKLNQAQFRTSSGEREP